jgi:hypothetical protein
VKRRQLGTVIACVKTKHLEWHSEAHSHHKRPQTQIFRIRPSRYDSNIGHKDEKFHPGENWVQMVDSESLTYMDDLIEKYLLFRGFTATHKAITAERKSDRLKAFNVRPKFS